MPQPNDIENKFAATVSEILENTFFSLITAKKIKASHLNSGMLHLNRKGANILSSSLAQHISKVFNWQLSDDTSCCNFSELEFEENEPSNLKQAKENCRSVSNSLPKDNLNKLIFAHLNINSIRNKLNYPSKQIRGNVDILLVSEIKIDDSFPQGHFVIDGFSAPYRLDRNCLGGGLMLFVRGYIPSNLLTIEEKPIESFYVEINLRNSK